MLAVMETETGLCRSSIVLPRWATERNPLRPSYGANVAAASAAMGRPLMPHQRLVVDVFLEVQSEEAGDPEPGEWAYNDGTVTMQRRGGKTAIQAPIVTHRARLVRGARMFMTAHKSDVARSRWLDITEDLMSSVLRDDVTRRTSITHEVLKWRDGGATLRPFTPSGDALHSETVDLVLVDEQWSFTSEAGRRAKAAYKPTFGTTGGQALKQSTAGDFTGWLDEDRRAGPVRGVGRRGRARRRDLVRARRATRTRSPPWGSRCSGCPRPMWRPPCRVTVRSSRRGCGGTG